MSELKIFTIEEANLTLPKLTKMIEEIREKRAEIFNLEVEIDALELMDSSPQGDRVSPALEQKMSAYGKIANRFRGLFEEIHATGCFMKDIDLGLVDFRIRHAGKVVCLCWMFGEETANHWHEVGEGFEVRKPFRHSTD